MAPLILVVDDEVGIREVLACLLTDEGYRVATARDGREALDSLVRELPAVIVSDIRMPRVHGLTMVERLRAWGHGTPVVLVSTWRPPEPLPLGVRFLAKPFDLQEVSDVVREAVAGG